MGNVGKAIKLLFVSIHAPGRGATSCREGTRPDVRCFNSRTREGCDIKQDRHNHRYKVSIHAPGRGATEGVPFTSDGIEFQFTHPGGVRPL